MCGGGPTDPSVGVGKQVEDCRGLDLRFQFMRIDSHAIKGQRVQNSLGRMEEGAQKILKINYWRWKLGGLGSGEDEC